MSDSGLFLIGAPRSGTTLLQTILAHHAELYSAPETSFFNRIVPELGIAFRDPDTPVTAAHIRLVEDDFRYMTGIELSLRDKVSEGESIRNVFEAVMMNFNKNAKDRWIEKTTNHARAMLLIRQFYPEARFIHLIRDPVDSVGSMLRIRPTDLKDFRIRYVSPIIGFARVWQKCVNGALRYPYQENVLHVFYEDLVGRPAETLRRICKFIDIRYADDLLDGFEAESESLLCVERSPWQEGNTQPGIRSGSIGKARQELSAGDVWLIQRSVKETASTMGYYVTSHHASLFSRIRTLILEAVRYLAYMSYLEFPLRKLINLVKK